MVKKEKVRLLKLAFAYIHARSLIICFTLYCCLLLVFFFLGWQFMQHTCIIFYVRKILNPSYLKSIIFQVHHILNLFNFKHITSQAHHISSPSTHHISSPPQLVYKINYSFHTESIFGLWC